MHVGYVTGKLPHYGAHLAQFECAVRRGRHLGVAEGRKATTNPNVPGLRRAAMRGVDAPHGQWHAFVARERNEGRVWRGDTRRSRGDAGMRAALFQTARTQGSACFGRGYTEDPPPYRDTLTPPPRAGIHGSPIGDTPRPFDPRGVVLLVLVLVVSRDNSYKDNMIN